MVEPTDQFFAENIQQPSSRADAISVAIQRFFLFNRLTARDTRCIFYGEKYSNKLNACFKEQRSAPLTPFFAKGIEGIYTHQQVLTCPVASTGLPLKNLHNSLKIHIF
jgi:hypothetical protein